MQEEADMDFIDNPFYILELPCSANRRTIIDVAEEMSFLKDPHLCNKAQELLLSPVKRLSAELDWFPEVKESDVLSQIQQAIGLNVAIQTSGLSGISALNAQLYNFQINKNLVQDFYGSRVWEIDKLFSGFDVEKLKEIVNSLHRTARIGEVTREDLYTAINEKRTGIKATISRKLLNMGTDAYEEYLSRIMKKYESGNSIAYGVVISDQIEQYVLNSSERIDSLKSQIKNDLHSIQEALSLDRNAGNSIAELTHHVSAFKKAVYPIIVHSSFTGVDTVNMETLGFAIRSCAIDAFNKYNKVDESISILKLVRENFSSYPELKEKLTEDFEVMSRVEEREKLISHENQDDAEYSVTLNEDDFFIPFYCTCCLKPTEETEKLESTFMMKDGFRQRRIVSTVAMPLCPECRKHRRAIKQPSVFLYIVLSCAVGLFFSYAAYVKYQLPAAGAALAGLIVPFIVLMFHGFHYTIPGLSKEHSSRGKSVRYVHYDNCKESKFTFSNKSYAALFKKANEGFASNIIKTPCYNSAKKSNLFHFSPNYALKVTCTLVVFFLVVMNNASDYFNDVHIPLDWLPQLNVQMRNTNRTNSPSRSAASDKTKSTVTAVPTKKQSTTTAAPTKKRSTATSTPRKTAAVTSTPKKTTQPALNQEHKFNVYSVQGSRVYQSIKQIEPVLGIYSEGSSSNKAVVCRCLTPENETVFVYLTIGEYKKYIDSTAILDHSDTAVFDIVRYDTPAKLHGVVIASESVAENILESVDHAKTMIEFSSIEKTKTNASNKDPVLLSTNPTVKPKATATPRVNLKKVSVSNGERIISPDYYANCPITIEASDQYDYYVYFEYMGASKKSAHSRAKKNASKVILEDDTAIFVKAGQKATTKMPVGIYKMYYACGKGAFYGTTDLFGEETLYYSADSLFEFYDTNDTYYGHTITLKTVLNGNLSTEPISEQSFPKR